MSWKKFFSGDLRLELNKMKKNLCDSTIKLINKNNIIKKSLCLKEKEINI